MAPCDDRIDAFLRQGRDLRLTGHARRVERLASGFFIHGGANPGSIGCIDLTSQMADFARRLAATPPGVKVKLTVAYGPSKPARGSRKRQRR